MAEAKNSSEELSERCHENELFTIPEASAESLKSMPPDCSDEKTPEDIFRERYALSPNKIFQQTVWELHSSGVPLKEAEMLVAQEGFPARETSTQLSFSEEKGEGGSRQQGSMSDSHGCVSLITKKARKAEAKKQASSRESKLGKPPKAPSKKLQAPTESFQPRKTKKRPSQNVAFHPFCEEIGPQPLPASKKARKPDPDKKMIVEEDEGYDTADEELFYDFEVEDLNAPPEHGRNIVRGDITLTNKQMSSDDFIDMSDLQGTVPSQTLNADMRASDIFKRMVRAEVFFSRWAGQTNEKYEQWKESGCEKRKDEEDETTHIRNKEKIQEGYVFGIKYQYATVATMYLFLSMCMFMTTMAMPNMSDYWSPISFALRPAFNWGADHMSGISFQRFRQLKKFMCYNVVREDDLETEGPRKGRTKDKLHRVRPFINLPQETFQALVHPGFLWSIDEGMVPYTGRFCTCRVYMKDKLHKFGIKIWMLCCAVTGFCLKFKVYEGRGDLFGGETPEFTETLGLGERVVVFFANLVRKGSHIFTDKFFHHSCPLCGTAQNEDLDYRHSHEEHGELNRRTCLALRMLSNRWYDQLFWGLIDMAITNSFIVYCHFHPGTMHSEFFEMLAEELFFIGKGMELPPRRQSSRTSTPVVPSTPATPTVGPSALVHTPATFVGKYKRSCFFCMKKGNFVLGTCRDKNLQNPTESQRRRQYPRCRGGCKSCNVALCQNNSCWDKYHAEFNGIPDQSLLPEKFN